MARCLYCGLPIADFTRFCGDDCEIAGTGAPTPAEITRLKAQLRQADHKRGVGSSSSKRSEGVRRYVSSLDSGTGLVVFRAV